MNSTFFRFNLISRLQKKIFEAVAEPEPVRLMTKPYVNGTVPYHSRSAKLVERFAELYKNDRIQVINSLRGMSDNSTAERFVFSIVEVRNKQDDTKKSSKTVSTDMSCAELLRRVLKSLIRPV